jgi:hypothetical protein
MVTYQGACGRVSGRAAVVHGHPVQGTGPRGGAQAGASAPGDSVWNPLGTEMVGAIGSHEGALATVEASISATGLRRREQGDDQGQSEGPSQHLSQRSSDARVDRKRGRASHPAIIHTRNIAARLPLSGCGGSAMTSRKRHPSLSLTPSGPLNRSRWITSPGDRPARWCR